MSAKSWDWVYGPFIRAIFYAIFVAYSQHLSRPTSCSFVAAISMRFRACSKLLRYCCNKVTASLHLRFSPRARTRQISLYLSATSLSKATLEKDLPTEKHERKKETVLQSIWKEDFEASKVVFFFLKGTLSYWECISKTSRIMWSL